MDSRKFRSSDALTVLLLLVSMDTNRSVPPRPEATYDSHSCVCVEWIEHMLKSMNTYIEMLIASEIRNKSAGFITECEVSNTKTSIEQIIWCDTSPSPDWGCCHPLIKKLTRHEDGESSVLPYAHIKVQFIEVCALRFWRFEKNPVFSMVISQSQNNCRMSHRQHLSALSLALSVRNILRWHVY